MALSFAHPSRPVCGPPKSPKDILSWCQLSGLSSAEVPSIPCQAYVKKGCVGGIRVSGSHLEEKIWGASFGFLEECLGHNLLWPFSPVSNIRNRGQLLMSPYTLKWRWRIIPNFHTSNIFIRSVGLLLVVSLSSQGSPNFAVNPYPSFTNRLWFIVAVAELC